MTDTVQVRPGTYHDSVSLMQASRAVQGAPGIDEALVAMATPLNLELLADMRFDMAPVRDAGPNDMIIAVRGIDDDAITHALAVLDDALQPTSTPAAGMLSAPAGHMVRSVAAEADLALISVPGEFAYVEAMDALRRGLHVMLFSDNVPLAQEVALKRKGEAEGLLVMGPDCGTAIVNGVGLGFANAVLPGPVGIVGAAGTGIQQICCLLDEAEVGVRHALGTGGRDLSAEVGASSTLRGLAALDTDPSVEVVVVVSKPPTPEVAASVRAAAEACSTPTVMALLGESGVTLEGAVIETLGVLGVAAPEFPSVCGPERCRPGVLKGLFSGGSLCSEAAHIASVLGPIARAEQAGAHTMVDYGGDEYTRGRAHPMIDQRVRLDRLEEAIGEPEVGVILLDVVLGHGANPDPASELGPVIELARADGPPVVVSLCGSRSDPQDRDRQASTLHEAGASVWLSNAAAARHAVSLVNGGRHE